MGLAHGGPLQPSIFIVGDRKQSIYAFRDADVRMLARAHRHVLALRPDGRVRRSIARSFRAAPELLAFTNDLFSSIDTAVPRADAFRFTARDRFPVETPEEGSGRLTLVAAADTTAAAAVIAAEVARLLADGEVRDRQTGLPRRVRPGDIAILFRSRASHREIEVGARITRDSHLRLQGPRVLRRRRSEGPGGSAPVPGAALLAAVRRPRCCDPVSCASPTAAFA